MSSLTPNSTLKKFIHVEENTLEDSLCDKILSEYEENEFIPSQVGAGEINSEIRNCSSIALSSPSIIEVNQKTRKEIDSLIFNSLNKAVNSYCKKNPNLFLKNDSGYDLLKYTEGQFYIQHIDSSFSHHRSISCSIALNDDHEGGELAFFDRKLKFKLKKGSAIFFPSNFMFPHEVLPIISGTRYSIMTWMV